MEEVKLVPDSGRIDVAKLVACSLPVADGATTTSVGTATVYGLDDRGVGVRVLIC
jgi:hypothetical protein